MQRLIERLPHRPYCADDLAYGLKIRSAKQALRHRHIQINRPDMINYLIFDIDHTRGAFEWIDQGLPAPTWIAENPSNGHAHIAYGLSAPVCRSPAAHAAPLRYAAAIESAYGKALGCDQGYAGLMTHNPVHRDWRVSRPAGPGGGYYELGYLAEFKDLPRRMQKRVEACGLGRNVDLFDCLRHWAYKNIDEYRRHGQSGYDDWMREVGATAARMNIFSCPLPASEVESTARSVGKWVWNYYYGTAESNRRFAKRQSARGKRSGRARLRAAMRAGLTGLSD